MLEWGPLGTVFDWSMTVLKAQKKSVIDWSMTVLDRVKNLGMGTLSNCH